MRARISLGKAPPCIVYLCFLCYTPLETVKVSRLHLWALRSATGWIELPPAVSCGPRHKMSPSVAESLPVRNKYCRSAKSAGRTCNSQQQRTELAWQYNSSNLCTNHVSYHGNDSKGHTSRFSDHQSRISMRDGPRDQVCTLWCQMQYKPIKQTKAQFLSPSQGSRHACKMQCNLGKQAKEATWHGKTLMQAYKQTCGNANWWKGGLILDFLATLNRPKTVAKNQGIGIKHTYTHASKLD